MEEEQNCLLGALNKDTAQFLLQEAEDGKITSGFSTCRKKNKYKQKKSIPRGNGQVERIHRTLIPVLSKLSLDDSNEKVQIRRQITKNTKQHYMSKHKKDIIRTFNRNQNGKRRTFESKDLLLEEKGGRTTRTTGILRNDDKKGKSKPFQSEEKKDIQQKKEKILNVQKKGSSRALQRTQFGK
ncbi:hypothetical protein TNIN_443931 [Trichonephila inaurata madagascariensis]|uniref:Uncharacterized protein n=1 Tax=Trichonephila inaurata madagascariensis TaxID=2747483 RepID=A0A8X6M718_9ARAC|nr:hypothetical protein TNIN_443931 [Trichonephila inaurata madagascariensis]